jgi:hypothetical protein
MRPAAACVIWFFCSITVSAAAISTPMGLEGPAGSHFATGRQPENSLTVQYSPAEIFSRLRSRHEWQVSRIDQLSDLRIYRLTNGEGNIVAEETVAVRYKAPQWETFTVSSGSGSKFVRQHVFRRLINYEVQRMRNRKSDDRLITSENYDLQMVGWDRVGKVDCLVVDATPKRVQKDLFRGKIWINNEDFAIVKIAGHLARSPSFWIKEVEFERNYVKIGDFWLPQRESVVSRVRIFGRKVMIVDYRNYVINGNLEPTTR